MTMNTTDGLGSPELEEPTGRNEQETAISGIVKSEPLKMSGSHKEREERAQDLAKAFVGTCIRFISDHTDEIIQVRQDFFDKLKSETIMGCRDFSEYCSDILHYSTSHIRRLIAGRNPATLTHDGSKNRKPKLRRLEAGLLGNGPTSSLYGQSLGTTNGAMPGDEDMVSATVSKQNAHPTRPPVGAVPEYEPSETDPLAVADKLVRFIIQETSESGEVTQIAVKEFRALATKYLELRSTLDPEPRTQKHRPTTSETKVPTFAYPGGKAKLARNIAALLPTGNRFVEPFAGRGNVFFHVAAHDMFRSYWLNDIRTAPFLSMMRIGDTLGVPKPGKESLYKYREVSRDKTKSPFARNHALTLEPYLCWNGGVYGQSGGTRRGTQAGYQRKLRQASEIMRGAETEITRLDYREVLANCGKGDVVYCDPPYFNGNVKAYDTKGINFPELVEILKNAKFKWVLSEYEEPLYVDAFGEPVLRIPVKRGMGKPGGGSKGSKETVECFWTNAELMKTGWEAQQLNESTSILTEPEDQPNAA